MTCCCSTAAAAAAHTAAAGRHGDAENKKRSNIFKILLAFIFINKTSVGRHLTETQLHPQTSHSGIENSLLPGRNPEKDQGDMAEPSSRGE